MVRGQVKGPRYIAQQRPEIPHERYDREVSLKNGSRKVTACTLAMESVGITIRREEPQNQHLRL